MKKAHGIILPFLFFLPALLGASVIYVPEDYPTIQAAIDAAYDGDTVVVSDGVYRGTNNKNLDFLGKIITVKSQNGPDNCIIDCQNSGRGFYFHFGEGIQSVVQGFTIKNGNIDVGGGVYCRSGASPMIMNCIITLNQAQRGGGIYCAGASPFISGTRFTLNQASSYGGAIFCTSASPIVTKSILTSNSADLEGGAIFCESSSAPSITNNSISNNEAQRYGGAIQCVSNSAPTINRNTIAGNHATSYDGGGIGCQYAYPLITNNTISRNTAGDDGGGISAYYSTPAIKNNVIEENNASDDGGGIFSYYSYATIANNTIEENSTGDEGGGIHCYRYSADIQSNRINNNASSDDGGGMYFYSISTAVVSNMISGNTATDDGGGLYLNYSSPDFRNNTMTGNAAGDGGGAIYCYQSSPKIKNCILWNDSPAEFYGSCGSPGITYSNIQGGHSGQGNIDRDPLFAMGPLGGYYLSQVEAGQSAESPCVDTGDPSSNVLRGTTRTDKAQDTDRVDMGYHYPMMARLIAGPGPAYDNPPHVRIFPPEQNANPEFEFGAYGPRHYGVNVTTGDVNGDGFDEIITGAGPGAVFAPHVRGFRTDGAQLPGLNFMAYGTRKYGVNVTCGDVDGDGFDEIITGAGPGAVFAPHVRAFDYDETATITPVPGVSFMAYGTHLWGVNVGSGDVDGDGFAEIITGPGPGDVFGPHIRGWNVDRHSAVNIRTISFLAYNTRKYGCVLSCGDVDGDGFEEIITAPGPSEAFGSHIAGWNYDGTMIGPMAGFAFFAWPSSVVRYGARVFSGRDIDSEGKDEVVVGAGPDPYVDSPVKVFRYVGVGLVELFSLQAFPNGWTHGANIVAGQF